MAERWPRLPANGRFRRSGAAAQRDLELQQEGRLRRGQRLRLLCHCAPDRCHAEGITRLLERRTGAVYAVADEWVGASGGGAGSSSGARGPSEWCTQSRRRRGRGGAAGVLAVAGAGEAAAVARATAEGTTAWAEREAVATEAVAMGAR